MSSSIYNYMGYFLEWIKRTKDVNENIFSTAFNWLKDTAIKNRERQERKSRLWNKLTKMRYWLFKQRHGNKSAPPVSENDPDMEWIKNKLTKYGPLNPKHDDSNDDDMDFYGLGPGVSPG